MKYVGVNTSHDASVAILEDDTLVDYYDEERYRRRKYWSPSEYFGSNKIVVNKLFESLLHNKPQVQDCDYVVFASFDRRGYWSNLETDWLNFDACPLEDWYDVNEFLTDFNSSPLSLDHIDTLNRKFPYIIEKPDFDAPEDDHDKFFIDAYRAAHFDHLDDDRVIFYPDHHHVYHALCGYWFSEWYKKEPAICVSWDGGGAKPYHKTGWPDFQENECIWRLEPGKLPIAQWKKLSNARALNNLCDIVFPSVGMKLPKTYFQSPNDKIKNINGVECLFTSKASNGVCFSDTCGMLDYEDLGRAAGKVMGRAAAGYDFFGNLAAPFGYNEETVTANLQEHTFQRACETLRKAVELNPDCKNIVLSGGFSLNCTNNYKYLDLFPEHNFFVDPAANDGGTAIGAALYQYYINRSQ